MVSHQCGYADIKLLCRLADVSSKTKNYNEIPDPEMWNKLLFNHPLRALLCAVYAMIEYGTSRYFDTSYDAKLQLWLPKHAVCDKLDLAYEGLRALGYEMSEEEVQMQKGTHPLFREVEDLIAAYNKEIKEEKKEKKKDPKKGFKKK